MRGGNRVARHTLGTSICLPAVRLAIGLTLQGLFRFLRFVLLLLVLELRKFEGFLGQADSQKKSDWSGFCYFRQDNESLGLGFST